MRIVIVEDDVALGEFVRQVLTQDGYQVELATDGVSGLHLLLKCQPDLLVLDLGLPQKDGIQVLTESQGRLRATSILVLTGRKTVQDRVQCLDLGADDCLVKPFSFHELVARCRALMRRRGQFAETTLRHGVLELNRLDRRVTCLGRLIDLTGKEYALLEFLIQARGRCCTRSELLREVWQMSPDAGTNVVDVYVNYLRKKLAHTNVSGQEDECQFIETVRGEGYMLGLGAVKRPVRSVGVIEGTCFSAQELLDTSMESACA